MALFAYIIAIVTLSLPVYSCAASEQIHSNLSTWHGIEPSYSHEIVRRSFARSFDTRQHPRKDLHLMKRIIKQFENKYMQKSMNLDDQIHSPLSIFIPMFVLSFGTRGEAKKKFIHALGIESNETRFAKRGFNGLYGILTSYNVRIATKLFYPAYCELHRAFRSNAEDFLHTTMESVNLENGRMPKRKINDWLAYQTDYPHEIDFYLKDQLGPGPQMVLANVIYLKSVWKTGFISSETKLRPFYVLEDGSPKDIMTMYNFGAYNYGEISQYNAKYIELPFKNLHPDYQISMFVILPDDIASYKRLRPRLREIAIKDLHDNGRRKNVHLYLPKFKVESEIPLNGWAEEFFGYNNAVNGPVTFDKLFLSTNMQLGPSRSKALIEIDEQGDDTEQETGSFYGFRPPRSIAESGSVEFKADRPFIALISVNGDIRLNLFIVDYTGSKLYWDSLRRN